MGDMVFDLVCQHCGGRDVRRWKRGDVISTTYCRRCRQGMSVIGIAFFAQAGTPELVEAAAQAA